MDYSGFYNQLDDPSLIQWAQQLPAQLEKAFDAKRFGDLPKWQAVIDQLPDHPASTINLEAAAIQVGTQNDITENQRQALISQLRLLHPWRKGPYAVFGIDLNTEWRSDWKWDRLKDHIAPLTGKKILDVGCGNGYHCWRMRAAGAELVVGIDPSPLFVMQYAVMQKYIADHRVSVLPLGIDDVPAKLEAFDSVFSMGVLYHRRSPIDHILQLKDCLKEGGELVLETLVVEGDTTTALLPEDRYARMGNVWFIPSVAMLEQWLRRCKFKNIRTVDVTRTSTDEQRSTEWMTFQSLRDFLDPQDASKSIEGYPAPTRAILIANK